MFEEKKEEKLFGKYNSEELPNDMLLFRGYSLKTDKNYREDGFYSYKNVKDDILNDGDKNGSNVDPNIKQYNGIYFSFDPNVAADYAQDYNGIMRNNPNARGFIVVAHPKKVLPAEEVLPYLQEQRESICSSDTISTKREVITDSFDADDIQGYFTLKKRDGVTEYVFHTQHPERFPKLKFSGNKMGKTRHYSEDEFRRDIVPYFQKLNERAVNEYAEKHPQITKSYMNNYNKNVKNKESLADVEPLGTPHEIIDAEYYKRQIQNYCEDAKAEITRKTNELSALYSKLEKNITFDKKIILKEKALIKDLKNARNNFKKEKDNIKKKLFEEQIKAFENGLKDIESIKAENIINKRKKDNLEKQIKKYKSDKLLLDSMSKKHISYIDKIKKRKKNEEKNNTDAEKKYQKFKEAVDKKMHLISR